MHRSSAWPSGSASCRASTSVRPEPSGDPASARPASRRPGAPLIHVGPLGPLWLLVGILAATLVVAVLAGRSSVPVSVSLVLIGFAVSIGQPGGGSPIPSELILAIVLPGLVFEAAFRTDVGVLRPTAATVFALAVPGVVIVAAIVGAVLAVTTGLSPTEGFLVGAMVAATDPAAVLSTFRRVPVPDRLATMVEMESLVNDGTGIVLFALALEMLGGGGSPGGAVVTFVVRVVGAAAIGGVLGWLAARLVRRLDDASAQLTLTVVLAYGTYLLAEGVGVSGVIATLVAAGTFGALGRSALGERAAERIDIVWDFAAFLLTAGVFLLVGIAIAPAALVSAAGGIAWAIAAVLAARALVVYGLIGAGSAVLVRLTRGRRRTSELVEPLPRSWLHVVFWAGLRGAVSVALALSIPAGLPHREVIQGLTYGIVLFTLIVQGTTAAWVVGRTGAAVGA